MNVVMDTDALIKITKSSLKELITSSISVYIPLAVKKESVDEGKMRRFPDAVVLERNIRMGRINVVGTRRKSGIEEIVKDLQLEGGEADSLRLFNQGKYDSIVSDDQKFLDLIDSVGIPFLTPAALIVYLYKMKKVSLAEARKCLDKIRDMISEEEYSVTFEELR